MAQLPIFPRARRVRAGPVLVPEILQPFWYVADQVVILLCCCGAKTRCRGQHDEKVGYRDCARRQVIHHVHPCRRDRERGVGGGRDSVSIGLLRRPRGGTLTETPRQPLQGTNSRGYSDAALGAADGLEWGRRRVTEGFSPKIWRYFAANRPKSKKPFLDAIAGIAVFSGSLLSK